MTSSHSPAQELQIAGVNFKAFDLGGHEIARRVWKDYYAKVGRGSARRGGGGEGWRCRPLRMRDSRGMHAHGPGTAPASRTHDDQAAAVCVCWWRGVGQQWPLLWRSAMCWRGIVPHACTAMRRASCGLRRPLHLRPASSCSSSSSSVYQHAEAAVSVGCSTHA